MKSAQSFFPTGSRGGNAIARGVMTATPPSPFRMMEGSGMTLPKAAAVMPSPFWQRPSISPHQMQDVSSCG
jgi:hypothetical protein